MLRSLVQTFVEKKISPHSSCNAFADKGYKNIMLNKKLKPTGPKNKKLVISRHTCKIRGKSN